MRLTNEQLIRLQLASDGAGLALAFAFTPEQAGWVLEQLRLARFFEPTRAAAARSAAIAETRERALDTRIDSLTIRLQAAIAFIEQVREADDVSVPAFLAMLRGAP